MEEIENNDTEVIEKEEKEVIENDKGGEIKEEEDKGKEKETEVVEDEFDDTKIEPEVRNRNNKQDVEEEEDDSDPEDRKRISKIVNKEVGSKVIELENKLEVQSLVHENPQYAKYQGAILKYMSHPSYSDIPAKNIAKMIAADEMMKIGAAKEREASKKVLETKNPGNNFRKPEGGRTNWLNASKEDYAAQRAKVLGH